ncbi:TetR family transcriptional regulator [Cryobacterium psychrophilum]|nr:TetR family transcriptional regulator [Cryobacterium psychrophilum]TDW29067.1 TetR family transcriptional regulator [Cryobacterium psychrophilum]
MLNIRSAHVSPPEDLTAVAKIRDAAIDHFATDGFRKASVRAIATTAGVSAGLVMHHFGSKEGLREACDDYVLGTIIRRAQDESSPEGLRAVLQGYLADSTRYARDLGYISRAITEDSVAGRRIVDAIIDETEQFLRAGEASGSLLTSSDPRALAAVLAMTSLGMVTMASHLARSLGLAGQGIGPAVMRRVALPTAEFYTHGLYTDDTVLAATREALESTPAS